MKIVFSINIVTFVLVNLKYQLYNDENKMSKSLENGNVKEITLLKKSHRMLAKYENQKELMNSRFHYETKDNVDNHKLVNKMDNNNTYEMLKQAKPNNMEAYLNGYKNRHSKKRGLKKLDCYYENKFFNTLDKIEKHAKEKNFSKSQIKKTLYKKYGLPLFLFSLLPVLTFALPDYIKRIKYIKKFMIICKVDEEKSYIEKVSVTIPTVDRSLRYIFFIISFLIVVLFIIYTYIKFLKYRRIRSGMLK